MTSGHVVHRDGRDGTDGTDGGGGGRGAARIEARGLTKRFGSTTAVDGLTFTVMPGRVTGFLGPNGAGKTTTLRMVLGLDAPSAGSVTVGGRPYARLREPLRVVGSLLDARGVHPGRTAHAHLAGLAASNGIPRRRVEEVLAVVGLDGAAVTRRRVGGFSLGMAQRLGVAAALLGDPEVLILDEPVNGLDTDGIRWIRQLLRGLAAEGRTVFLSSHLMSEMELTADHLVVIGRGRLLADAPVREVIASRSAVRTVVRGPLAEAGRLRETLEAAGARVEPHLPRGEGDGERERGGERWLVSGLDAAAVGERARAAGLALHELTPLLASLEEVYTAIAADQGEHQAGGR
ncbi:ATP-binding cassette domain-containing protein [Streptomyces sp. 4N509B]|uniref:ATP-binding cassette domain-containing protein n=1 Tax=Streptomyces sp. 4N509B TaxID=3457413 RepID=UPI003FD24EC4